MAERPPGGAFGPAQTVSTDILLTAGTVALADDGAAAIAWNGEGDTFETIARPGPGAFGPPFNAGGSAAAKRNLFGSLPSLDPEGPPSQMVPSPQVTLAPDGSPLVAGATSRGLWVGTAAAGRGSRRRRATPAPSSRS